MRQLSKPARFSLLLAAFICVGVFCSAVAFPKGKTKGQYFQSTGLVQNGKVCTTDSAQGWILRVDQDHENPLFESKSPNRIHLLMWFKDSLVLGERIQLPSPRVEVCYWEQGDLLMFHTNKPLGWIEFTAGKMGGKLEGKMEFKLIEPDHNMSNSDYHFMGGDLSLSLGKP